MPHGRVERAEAVLETHNSGALQALPGVGVGAVHERRLCGQAPTTR